MYFCIWGAPLPELCVVWDFLHHLNKRDRFQDPQHGDFFQDVGLWVSAPVRKKKKKKTIDDQIRMERKHAESHVEAMWWWLHTQSQWSDAAGWDGTVGDLLSSMQLSSSRFTLQIITATTWVLSAQNIRCQSPDKWNVSQSEVLF